MSDGEARDPERQSGLAIDEAQAVAGLQDRQRFHRQPHEQNIAPAPQELPERSVSWGVASVPIESSQTASRPSDDETPKYLCGIAWKKSNATYSQLTNRVAAISASILACTL